MVDNIQVGDRVVLVAAGSLSSVKVVNKDLVVKIPDSLDFVQAATLPISYITAIHALSSLKSGQVCSITKFSFEFYLTLFRLFLFTLALDLLVRPQSKLRKCLVPQ